MLAGGPCQDDVVAFVWATAVRRLQRMDESPGAIGHTGGGSVLDRHAYGLEPTSPAAQVWATFFIFSFSFWDDDCWDVLSAVSPGMSSALCHLTCCVT